MKCNVCVVTALIAVCLPVALHAQSARELVEQAEYELRDSRYAEAESTLNRAVEAASGETLRKSLFLLAGLQSSVDDADRLYRRIIDDDPDDEWARRAYLELSKIQYALGNYGESFRILEDSHACDISEEACLFHGLSAIMLERFEDARRPLTSIRRGKLRTWAYLSLAEVETGLNRPQQACARYEALARSMINPTALYRYAECRENEGDLERATREYEEIIRSFRDTPEAVLAAEKISRLAAPPQAASVDTAETAAAPEGEQELTAGFTIQFGSFRDRGNAIKLAAKIKRVFPGVRIDSNLINYREYHRVRYGYFNTREEARARAEQIAREMNEDYTIMTLP